MNLYCHNDFPIIQERCYIVWIHDVIIYPLRSQRCVFTIPGYTVFDAGRFAYSHKCMVLICLHWNGPGKV